MLKTLLEQLAPFLSFQIQTRLPREMRITLMCGITGALALLVRYGKISLETAGWLSTVAASIFLVVVKDALPGTKPGIGIQQIPQATAPHPDQTPLSPTVSMTLPVAVVSDMIPLGPEIPAKEQK